MTTSIGIGLLGLGLHGTRYARHIVAGDVPGAHLAAVWRRDRERGRQDADDYGARFVEDMDALIRDDDVDAIIAAVPAGLHPEIAARTAAAKKPLLCEKPLGRTSAEASDIVQRFADADVLLTVAQTLRFDPLVVALRERIDALEGLTGFCFEQRIEPRGLGWEDRPEDSGGGVLIQTGIHTLDALRVITRPHALHVRAATLDRHVFRHVEDHALLTVELEAPATSKLSRVVGQVATSKIGGSRHMRFALYGEAGGLEADFIGRTLTTVRGREQHVESMKERPTVAAIASAFVRAIRGEGPNPVPGNEGLLAVRAVEDAYRAASVNGR